MSERMPNQRPIGVVMGCALALACASEHSSAPEPAANEPPRAAGAKRKPDKPVTGPIFAVQAGAGIGAIRLGANVATIERLMDLPCEIKAEHLCRYVSRAVDFHLVGGETSWIHIQGPTRPAGRGFRGEPLEFGAFNGAIPPGKVVLGWKPSAIQEFLGAPERVEYVPQPNPANVIERHYYPGLVAEYDLITVPQRPGDKRPPDKVVVLGGLRIVKKPPGTPPG